MIVDQIRKRVYLGCEKDKTVRKRTVCSKLYIGAS